MKGDVKMNEIIEKEEVVIEDMIYEINGKEVMLDSDLAELYHVETKRINEAVKNNPEKFPKRYLFRLSESDCSILKSKFSTSKGGSRKGHTAFTEQGIYMLATILKGDRAISTTLAIVDTFVQIRELARTMEALQNVEDGGEQQRTLLQRTGNILAEIVGHNLSTRTTETEIELNFAVVKIKHKIIRKDE